mgnify:CR=1 FL=1
MAINEIPKLIEKINLVAELVSYTAPSKATEKVVKTLQAEGPRWTGLFSNSYVINAEQYGLLANGSKQEGNPTPVLFGKRPSRNSVRKVLAAGKSTFLIGNDVYYADQAADLETFRPPNNPNFDLPLKTQIIGERRDRRGLAVEDLTGPNTATAPLDWFTDYAQKGGRMQKEVETTFKNVFNRFK